MDFDKSQLMRGTLEGCILKIISVRTTYGYEIIELLRTSGFKDVSEGTIYPILMRLLRAGMIVSELLPSPLGPKRKYYTITETGLEYLSSFYSYWTQISTAVAEIFGEEGSCNSE